MSSEFFNSDPLTAILQFVLLVVSLLVGLAFEGAVLYVIYFVLTLPMRRNERARMFLDLIELGLKEGQTPEAAIVGAASSYDTSLGARFYILAAHLQKGMRLSAGLEQVPHLLPPQAIATLEGWRAHWRCGQGFAGLPQAGWRRGVASSRRA